MIPAPRRLRVRYTNRAKCALCYLISFALPVLCQLAGLIFVYPYKLAGTAPNVALRLTLLLPFLNGALGPLADACEPSAAFSAQALRSALAVREQGWLMFLTVCALAAWLITLVIQLVWRFAHRAPIQAARATRRAVRAYRLATLAVCLINAAFAAFVWFAGVRHIAGRTAWDFIAYFGCYPLNALAAICVSRLAAPPSISGRHAFFKRL